MDVFEYITTSARRVGGFTASGNTGNESRENDTKNDDELTRVHRLLTLLKLVLVIIATTLTIARMPGWL